MTTIDGRETAPAAMRPDSVLGERRAAPVQRRAATAASPSACPGRSRPGTRRSSATARSRSRRRSRRRSGSRATASSSTRPSSTRPRATSTGSTTSRPPRRSSSTRTGRRSDVGTVFRNPDLARAYERIAHLGAKGFYRGAIADALVETVQHPLVAPTANHVWRPGVMTMRDLHTYEAPERAPTRVGYRGLDVYGMGPPSSGGSTVGEALNILEGYPLATMTREAALHLFLEASRFSFADRGAYLADPAYFDVPLRGLLSDGFAATRRALITATAATSPVAPGDPYPFNGRRAASVQASASETRARSTTHLSVGRPLGQRRLVHVHDRVDRRRRPRRPRLGLPAQQRADGLRLRLADAPEPRRGRQAAAQLDGADDRAPGRRAAARGRLARAARRSSRPSSRSWSTGSISA